MKLWPLLLSATLLTACGGFDEPDWLSEARSLEKERRPLCMRLTGTLNNIDKQSKAFKDQKQYSNYLASQRGQVASAHADCQARSKTYAD